MTTSIPRPEYPRPQFVRDAWINLNGPWTCEIDLGKSGYDAGEIIRGEDPRNSRGLWRSKGFAQPITVPFCPESKLSGIGHTDFIEMIWYHRVIQIPSDWTQRVVLHFGGVDYHSDVFIDGKLVGRHAGGQCAFEFEITAFVKPGGTHDLVVCARDNLRTGVQPSGKQSHHFHSGGCHYTRVTGIWQTVWLESVPMFGLHEVHIVPDLDGACFHVTPTFWAVKQGYQFRAMLRAPRITKTDSGKSGDMMTVNVVSRQGAQVSTVTSSQIDAVSIRLATAEPKPWAPGSPHLYELDFEVIDASGAVVDLVRSYAGLRKIHIEGNRIYLNNEPLYQRLVLDQGFYPDGIWTAPNKWALVKDIQLSMAAGFNGARLHQKVFEPQFHYWADKLGYLTWGEASSWGCDANTPAGRDNFLREWREIVVRDRNHPSIITWTPWNEMWGAWNEEQYGRTLNDTYDLTKVLDPTRPVNTASGGAHCKTDIWSVHCYEQNGPGLSRITTARADPQIERIQKILADATGYAGQPVLLDEFGGIKWQHEGHQASKNDWGYGDAPKSLEEFHQRLDELLKAIYGLAEPVGYCYTQLTDVEQEVNGIYTYDRQVKFDMKRVRKTFVG